MKYFIGGCGLTGAIIAERIASVLKEEVEIFEARDHIGGNCASFIEPETGIECHRRGPHIFHMTDARAINYITRFCTLNNYRHRVIAVHAGDTWCMPINLQTINKFYKRDFSQGEAAAFIAQEKENNPHPANLEEEAVSRIGRPLYEAFIRNYTIKQWGLEPKELPASILGRIEFRTSSDCDYFNAPFQGLPVDGYENLFRKITANPLIKIHLGADFLDILSSLPDDAVVIHTGRPDALFSCCYGPLAWRSLRFEWENLPLRSWQETAVVNYVDCEPAYTRIHEYKHFHPERRAVHEQEATTICREYPAEYGPGKEVFYPINDPPNNELYEKYRREAEKRGIILAGRLGGYQYIDMGEAIANALAVFENRIKRRVYGAAAQ